MKLFFICFLIMLFLAKPAFAKFDFAGDVEEVSQKENIIEFRLSDCLFNIYVLEDNIIRFRYTQKESFSEAPSYGVIWDGNKETEFSFEDKGENFELITEELKVLITKKPCRISIYDKDGTLINRDEPSFGVSFDGNEVRCFKELFKEEQFFGLGEKTGYLQRKGSQYMMWNSDTPFYIKEEDPLYQSIPFFTGLKENKAYGIFFDNTYKSHFCMGAGNDRFYWFGAEGGEMDYYFIYGPEMKRVVSSYTDITGKMSLPPLWSLGYQQSRWSYFPDWKVMEVAENFRKKDIPCDVIYLDIDYMNGYRVFTWDKERFPEPEKMLSDLATDGFKIVPIIDPGVKADEKYETTWSPGSVQPDSVMDEAKAGDSYYVAKEGIEKDLFAKYPDGTFYKGEVWPSWAYFPDFTKKETQDWWGEKLAGFLNMGIEGFWNDMNEPAVWGKSVPDIIEFSDNGYGADHKKIHNVYALKMAEATFNSVKASGKRHFILTRAGYAGIQRYSAVWTGDNVSNEDHLLMACLIPQSLGISGVPFVGSDVGGFGGSPSQNLYIRWMELGAFTPFFRGHACRGTPEKEPWALGEDTEIPVRDAIKQRYQFLPYLYNEFYNASITGLPIMRPVFLNYQNDPECYKKEAQEEFMLGENLLVAPVLSENNMAKKLYLPEGKWVSFREGKVYEGKEWIVVDAPLNYIPLFVREGGVIVLQESQNYVGEKEISEYEFRIFPGEKSTYEFYEDDGITYQYENGVYSVTKIDINKKNDTSLEVAFSKPLNNYDSKKESYLIKLYDMKNPSEITFSGKLLKVFDNIEELNKSQGGFFFDSQSNILSVKVKAEDEFILKCK